MTQDIPYFMKNEEWYYHDEVEWCYKLTNKAPEEAIKSYEEFYSEEDEVDYSII